MTAKYYLLKTLFKLIRFKKIFGKPNDELIAEARRLNRKNRIPVLKDDEKRARRTDIAYIRKYFEGVCFRRIDGMNHGELVMIHLSQFDDMFRKAFKGELL